MKMDPTELYWGVMDLAQTDVQGDDTGVIL